MDIQISKLSTSVWSVIETGQHKYYETSYVRVVGIRNGYQTFGK